MFVRASLLLVALASSGTDSPRSFGDIGSLIREHDTSPKVALGLVLARPHAYGLGSLSGLRGEITILDGQAWLAYPPKSKSSPAIRVVTTDTDAEKAAFLVATYVEPNTWRKIDLPAGLASKDLESTLDWAARAHGLDNRELVFRVKGTLETLTLAIIDGRRVPPGPGTEDTLKAANVLQKVEGGAEAELVGFYTPASQSPFTHPGNHAHVHAVVPSKRATGHAQDFTLKPGATLWLQLPNRTPPSS